MLTFLYPNIIYMFADNNYGDYMQGIKEIKKNSVIFSVGGFGYGTLEVMWRGYTHWSMVIAGGISFLIFSRVAENFRNRPLIFKAVFCALGVTAVELVFGIIFNIILKENVWDYSELPLNFLGQICPLYTLLWGALSCIFLPLADTLNKKFS